MIALVVVALFASDTVADRFAAAGEADGFVRADVVAGSFGDYLRRLPLLPKDAKVTAFDGAVVDPAWAQAVVDLDVGTRDLQQCADSALRVYAEYRWQKNDVDTLSFHATSGDPLPWSRYRDGDRPVVKGNKIAWQAKKAKASSTHETFRRWLDDVFMWAGSKSIDKDTVAVVGDVEAGDVLVKGGSPGHVLVVLDVAAKGAARRVLIAQGYMPAQSFHVLGWFDVDEEGGVTVPSWPGPFAKDARRRFR